MQSLLLPGIPSPHISFRKHRFDSDPSRFSLNLSLANSRPRSSLRASYSPYLSPPMSGSPPPEHPQEESRRENSRRRRRSESPITTAPAAPSVHTFAGQRTQGLEWQGQQEGMGQAFTGGPPGYMMGATRPEEFAFSRSTQPFPRPTTAAQETYFTSQSPIRSPTTARRPKAHVASACVNCKRKHLRCDATRPCRRCVQAGKEDSCVDVVHKKRGRPPLKAEDSQQRRLLDPGPGRPQPTSVAPQLSPPLPAFTQQRPPLSREIRPSTELQPQAQGFAGREGGIVGSSLGMGMGMGMLSQQAPYGPPTLSPSLTVAVSPSVYGLIPGSRPFSRGSSAPSSQPQSPFFSSPTYGTPVGQSPLEVPRSMPSYLTQHTSYGIAPPPPPSQQQFATPFAPYLTGSRPSQRPQYGEHTAPREYAPPQTRAEIPSGYQLPPIRPAPLAPAPVRPLFEQQQRREEQATWSTRTRQQQHRQQVPFDPGQQAPRTMLGPQQQQQRVPEAQQEQQSRSGEEETGEEEEDTGDPRPKRQKMNLGEMLGPRND